MKTIMRCGLIPVVLALFFSCELFQLQPAARENPKDPGSDAAVLFVVSITPSDGTAGIETNAVITVTFSETVDPATVTSDTFTVTASGSTVEGTLYTAEEQVTFIPSAPLTVETEYTVTLATGIHNEDGTGMETAVTGAFTTRTRRWETPVLVETDYTNNAQTPQVAVDPEGNAVAVWIQTDGTFLNVLSSRYTPGNGWGAAEPIEGNDGNAFAPRVAVDSEGNAIAVWHQYDATVTQNIWSNSYTPGTGWGTAVLIEADDTGNAADPQVAINSAGNAVAVWQQDDGTYINVMANRYTPGTGWDTADVIDAGTGETQVPQVAIDPDGNALAVWRQYEDVGGGLYRWNIRANRYSTTGDWAGTADLLETDNANMADDPQVAADSDGNAMAVWNQNRGLGNSIYSNSFTAGTGWGISELAEADTAGENSYDPRIAMSPGGGAVVVWSQYDGTRYNIWANRYTPGSGWSTEELLETDDAGDASKPQVAVDPNGNAVAVWYQNDGTDYNIWANRYTPGSGWGTAELIETDDSGDALYPRIAMDPEGNAVAIWQIQDGYGNPHNIYAAHYR